MRVSGWKSEIYGEQDDAQLFWFCLNYEENELLPIQHINIFATFAGK